MTLMHPRHDIPTFDAPAPHQPPVAVRTAQLHEQPRRRDGSLEFVALVALMALVFIASIAFVRGTPVKPPQQPAQPTPATTSTTG